MDFPDTEQDHPREGNPSDISTKPIVVPHHAPHSSHETHSSTPHGPHEPAASTTPTSSPIPAPGALAFESTSSTPVPQAAPAVPSLDPAFASPDAPPPLTTATPHQSVNAGLVVLQWLTYALWGWTVLGLSILTSTIIANLINDADVGSFTPYGIAAVLVLLPISYVCDTFYAKREPTHKTGPETLVMVVHAVLFALFGIGSLIFAVFTLVQLLVDPTNTDYVATSLLSSLIIAAYYGLTFLRTLNPVKFSWIKRLYKLFMLVSVGIIIVLGIVGPVSKEHSLRNDRLIEAELTNVQDGVKEYARGNKKLPADLHAITVDGDTKKLVDQNLINYKPNTKEALVSTSTSGTTVELLRIDPKRNGNTSQTTIFYYQFCVTYKKAASGYDYTTTSDADKDGYSAYLDTSDHPAGNFCYKLTTGDY